MAKNNDTFGVEDEWYLEYGPQLTPEEAKTINDLAYKLIKKQIKEAKHKVATFKEGGIDWIQSRWAHRGLLWKYQHVIQLFNRKPTPAVVIKETQWKPPAIFKKPSIQ